MVPWEQSERPQSRHGAGTWSNTHFSSGSSSGEVSLVSFGATRIKSVQENAHISARSGNPYLGPWLRQFSDLYENQPVPREDRRHAQGTQHDDDRQAFISGSKVIFHVLSGLCFLSLGVLKTECISPGLGFPWAWPGCRPVSASLQISLLCRVPGNKVWVSGQRLQTGILRVQLSQQGSPAGLYPI